MALKSTQNGTQIDANGACTIFSAMSCPRRHQPRATYGPVGSGRWFLKALCEKCYPKGPPWDLENLQVQCKNRYQSRCRKSIEKWYQHHLKMEPKWSRNWWNNSLVRERVILRKLYSCHSKTNKNSQSNIDANSKLEKWGEHRGKTELQWSQHWFKINRCKYRFKNRCETCDPQIHNKSSLGAPKGRQSDFEYSEAWSSWAGEGSSGPRENKTLRS